jgi:fatty acid desaturase
MTFEDRAGLVRWYRSPVDGEAMHRLCERSDLLAWAQTLGYILTLLATGSVAYYSSLHWGVLATIALVFLHGTCFGFMINAVHELGHGTVFKSRSLNAAFADLFAFLGWINHRTFAASHLRHHRSTLHPPDDLEVVVPIKYTVKDFIKNAFVSPLGLKYIIRNHIRIARGRIPEGEWETKLFPESAAAKRQEAISWSRAVLAGQACIVVGSLATHLWMLPVLITLAPFYGGCLFFFCNNTQHVGLQDYSTDFRLCARTFVPNPVVRFLYWHMNFHVEHHMYVAVPCYNLHKLRRLIEGDLPPAKGIIGTWIEIGQILRKQREDPSYVYVPVISEREHANVTAGVIR